MPTYTSGTQTPWYSRYTEIKKVVIKDGVTNIGNCAFAWCDRITSVEIPNSVTSIAYKAFSYCMNLPSIEIPNSVTSIGGWAFDHCTSLTSITFKGSTPPTFGNDVFWNDNTSIPVYVPANSGESYKKALERFGFSNIREPMLLKDNSNAYTRNSQIDGVDVSYTRDFSNLHNS